MDVLIYEWKTRIEKALDKSLEISSLKKSGEKHDKGHRLHI